MLDGKTIAPSGQGKPARAVVILHGLGDNAAGIIGLGEAFRAVLPDTVFLAPNAPFPCPYCPGGYQWFGAEDWSSAVVLEGVKKASTYLNEYLDNVLATYELTADKLALTGFSQGSMMSLYAGPRRSPAFAGILAYSGALVGGDSLETEKKSSPPVLLVHGMSDSVVPFAHMAMAESGLKKSNIPVSSLACPGLDHGIDDNGLREGAYFLRRTMGL